MARKNGKRKRYIFIGIAGVALIGGAVAVSAFIRGNNKIDPAKLAKVERGDLAKSVVATGKVEAITRVQVKSKASGIVKTLNVQVGDTARTGQILAELDTSGACYTQDRVEYGDVLNLALAGYRATDDPVAA